MGLCQRIDRTKLLNLLVGMLGIYSLYFISGILHQSLPHYNRFTQNYEVCDNAPGLLFVPFLAAWLMGSVYNMVFIQNRAQIATKNSAMTGGVVLLGTIFSVLAIQKTSFTVVTMFESCSILSVVFVGVFCSRVADPNLKLGPKKIIIAIIITVGILIFQFADPQTKTRQVRQQFIGIMFLLFHFVSEGFLPDLQAEIKVNFKPEPTQMMAQINKWATILTLLLAIITFDAWPFVVFMWEHLEFTADLIVMSITSGFGQFFVYRMIKQFKQHFVPFTISSRKILTVAISIALYGHQTNWIQIMGILIVLVTVFVQFFTELSTGNSNSGEEQSKQDQQPQELVQQKNEQFMKASLDASQKEGTKNVAQQFEIQPQIKTVQNSRKIESQISDISQQIKQSYGDEQIQKNTQKQKNQKKQVK